MTGTCRSRLWIALAGLLLSGGAGAEVRLRVADPLPDEHAAHAVTRAWIARIAELTGGTVACEHFPAERLAKAKDMLDAAQNGVADIVYLAAPVHAADRMPLFGVTQLPIPESGAEPRRALRAVWELGQGALLDLEMLPHGVRPIRAGATQSFRLVTGRTKVTTLADLKGLRIRVDGAARERAVAQLGGVGVVLPPSETLAAMRSGTVDGAVLTLATTDGGLPEPVKHALVNLDFGVQAWFYAINEATWRRLTQAQRDAILRAGRELIDVEAARERAQAEEQIRRWQARGIDPLRLSSEELARWAAALRPARDDWAAAQERRGAPGRRVLTAWLAAVAQ